MRRTTTNQFVITALTAGIVSTAGAQQFTTVVTHGFTAGAKGLWDQGMAEAVGVTDFLEPPANWGPCP